MWIGKDAWAKFLLTVLIELQGRGQDILVVAVDNLRGY